MAAWEVKVVPGVGGRHLLFTDGPRWRPRRRPSCNRLQFLNIWRARRRLVLVLEGQEAAPASRHKGRDYTKVE